MKTRVARIRMILLAGLFPLACVGQLNNGGLYSGFGVDADTRATYMKYGLVTGAVISDDWFAPSGSGYNVIDTSNAAAYLGQLQSGGNFVFSKRMSQLLYAKVGGRLWLDAVYGRDFSSAANFKDTTVFTTATKNGDDPNIWTGGISSVPNKNDLVDFFAHMRRDGITAYDSLWFFTGIAAFGNAANSYYNVELYKNNFGYNSGSGTFLSAGTSGGHTEWLFDASGNVTQTGDMIVAVNFFPGIAPVVDVRIWVSTTTYNALFGGALAPKYFNFNANYSTTSGIYGYASIVTKSGSTAFGAGIANYTGAASSDTTMAAPWGTTNSTTGWSSYYVQAQFIEVGLNLTRIGVDPALYSTLNPCQSMFSDIFVASRSSNSFTAQLKDFIAPLTFLRTPVLDYSLQGDTLRCNHPTGTITLTNNSTAGLYAWKTLAGGGIGGANTDSSQLTITKPGTYIVSATAAIGCPATRVDTIVVPIDTFPPVASAWAGLSGHQLDLYGGDPVASNYPTPFGGSRGLTYAWTGPNSFSSTVQNPMTDTAWGTYDLTVTEKRNGCTAVASTFVTASMFEALFTQSIELEASVRGQEIDLVWQDADQTGGRSYVVERSDGVSNFTVIGIVGLPRAPGTFAFSDLHPLTGTNIYRVKAVSGTGEDYYSQTVTIGFGASPVLGVRFAMMGAPVLYVNTQRACNAVLVAYSISGQVLEKRGLAFGQGSNAVTVSDPAMAAHSVSVLALYIDGRVVWCQKVFF
jgi:hypothetical protein